MTEQLHFHFPFQGVWRLWGLYESGILTLSGMMALGIGIMTLMMGILASSFFPTGTLLDQHGGLSCEMSRQAKCVFVFAAPPVLTLWGLFLYSF